MVVILLRTLSPHILAYEPSMLRKSVLIMLSTRKKQMLELREMQCRPQGIRLGGMAFSRKSD